MAVTLTGSGGLFTRLGSIFKVVEVVETHVSDLSTRIDTADGTFDSNERDLVLPLVGAKASLKAVAGSVMSACWQAASTTLIQMVYDDAGIESRDLDTALREIVRQMEASSDSINQTSVTGPTVAAVSGNTGNGMAIAYVRDPSNVRTETAVFECVADGQLTDRSSSVRFRYNGTAREGPRTDPNWDVGSDSVLTIVPSDADTSRGSGYGANILYNSNFETWTTLPDGWTVEVGDATSITQSATAHRGDSSLSINGDGAELTRLSMRLDGAASSGMALVPDATYIISFWYRDGASAPTAGVLRVSVRDAANNVVGSSNLSVNASAGTSTWQNASVLVSVPTAIKGSSAKIVIELTTAIDSGKSMLIDDLVLARAYPLQGGTMGAHGIVVHGSTEFVVGDRFTCAITNNKGGKFVRHLDRAFDLRGKGIVFPSSGSPTVSDSLVA